MLLAVGALAGQPARMGSAFATVYDAFAPLGVLHRSYADFLFYGTDVVVPDDLDSACEETGYLLALLHIDLLVQTGPQAVAVTPRLARLRADVAIFCDRFSGTLTDILYTNPPDPTMLKVAGELGLFSDIYGLQQGLQSTFEAYLDGFCDEQAMWEFAVAFALRTLLDQEELRMLEPSLRDILYGSTEALFPPAFVPQDVASAIVRLVEFIGVPLEAAMIDEIRACSQLIYEYVLDEPDGMGGGKAGC